MNFDNIRNTGFKSKPLTVRPVVATKTPRQGTALSGGGPTLTQSIRLIHALTAGAQFAGTRVATNPNFRPVIVTVPAICDLSLVHR